MRYFVQRSLGKLIQSNSTSDCSSMESNGDFAGISPEAFARISSALPILRKNLVDLHKEFRGVGACHILANGPSMSNFRKSNADDLVIGVNASGLRYKLDYWMILDSILGDDRDLNKFLRKYWKNSTSKHVLPAGLAMEMMADWPDYLPHAIFNRAIGPASITTGLYWHGSTVHAALDLCRHCRPPKVCLWGLDYADRSHFYTGSTEIRADSKDNPGRPWDDLDRHKRAFAILAREMGETKVVNMNPSSAIECFEKCRIMPTVPAEPALEPEPKPEPVATIPAGKPEPKPKPALAFAEDDYLMVKLFAFYTMDSAYEGLASRCVKSFRRRGVTVHAVPMRDKKNWMGNILQRIGMFKSLANLHSSETVGLLDCDLVCQLEPKMFAGFQGDVALHHRAGLPENHEYSAGVVLVRPTQRARAFLDRWAEKCLKDKDKKVECREQLYLRQALLEDPDLRVHDLGDKYNNKPEHVRPNDGTIIIHDPASRKTLPELGGKR